MAFLQKDPAGDFFINISQSVGRGKGFANTPNDVLTVQALLELIYNNSTRHKARRPQKGRPVIASLVLLQDTPFLIADFQRNDLGRAKPQGFCNRAPLSGSSQFRFNTLVNLWNVASLIALGLGSEDLLTRLKRQHPSLRNLPILFGDQG